MMPNEVMVVIHGRSYVFAENEIADCLVEHAMDAAEEYWRENRRDDLLLNFEIETAEKRGIQCFPNSPFEAVYDLAYSTHLKNLLWFGGDRTRPEC